MANQVICGFEFGALEKGWSRYDASNVPFDTGVYRGGARSLRIGKGAANWAYYAKLDLPTAKDEIYVQFAFYTLSVAATQIFAWRSGSTILGGIQYNGATGKLEAYTGNFASKVITGTTSLSVSTWYVIEAHIKIADSGAIALRLNGLGEGSDYSGDTKPGADTTIDNLMWGGPLNASGTYYNYIDDVIVNDTLGSFNNSWPDGLKVVRLAPTADAGTNQMTCSAGSDHYALVDEVPPSATDNLQGTSAALVEKFTMADLPAEAKSVGVVQALAFALKGSSNNPDRLKLGLRTNSTDYKSSELDLALAEGAVHNIWDNNPDTSLIWGVSAVNGLELIAESAD